MLPADLLALLHTTVARGASDLLLVADSPPQLRIDGALLACPGPALAAEAAAALCLGAMNAAQRAGFERELECDFALVVPGLARFRVNVYRQRGAVGAVFRQIAFRVRTAAELGLPAVLTEVARRPRGLVLITGPTGSGKTTTLAALIDQINEERHGHIVTVEDPIEVVHAHKNCIVSQRELGVDTQSFAAALKHVLRQAPDVVLIGEMRDLETVEAALTIAETGHLALATLHTNSTVQTLHRIIDVFEPHRHAQVRAQLALTLEAVVCQALLPAIGGGRAMAMEILIPNAAVRNLIREDKAHQITSSMQAGRARTGMQTLNQSLHDLVLARRVRLEDALAVSSDPDALRTMLLAAPPAPRAR